MFFIVTPFQKVALPASLRDLLILAESNFENKSKRQNFILCCKILRNLLLLSPGKQLDLKRVIFEYKCQLFLIFFAYLKLPVTKYSGQTKEEAEKKC